MGTSVRELAFSKVDRAVMARMTERMEYAALNPGQDAGGLRQVISALVALVQHQAGDKLSALDAIVETLIEEYGDELARDLSLIEQQEPAILTVDTFTLTPGRTEEEQRETAWRYSGEVAAYLGECCFEVTRSGGQVIATRQQTDGRLTEVYFEYLETRNFCHRLLEITVDGEPADLSALTII